MNKGIPFWGGSRRIPTSISFNPSSNSHREFVLATSMLRLITLGLSRDSINTAEIINAYEKIASTTGNNIDSNTNSDDIAQMLINKLKSINIEKAISFAENLKAEEFEKDDLSLGHVDFVSSAGNCYLLPRFR